MAKGLCNDELVVSFLNLPAYITDAEIIGKLDSWGVGAASPIRRRMWPGTKIADGTRFLKVKFSDRVQSLPYLARFETALGPEYFRVIHDRQVKVCRMCLQPGHILRDCPEFFCHKCGVQGHYVRECGAKRAGEEKKCLCCNMMSKCTCKESGGDEEDEEVFNEKEAVASAESFSGSEGTEEEEEEGMEQEGLCKGAGVAVMADLARAGPPEQEVPLAGPGQAERIVSSLGGTVAADMGRRPGGASGSEEDSELSSAQVPEGAAGSAGAEALLGGMAGSGHCSPSNSAGRKLRHGHGPRPG